jgi:protein dithiol oxidoreductase (disulfide-forming)
MKRYALLFTGLLLLPLSVLAQAPEKFQAGKDYQVLNQQAPVVKDGNVEVIEFFNYGCPGCFFVEATVKEWLTNTPDHVDFQRIPVVLTPQWRSYAQAYHAAQAIGIEDRITPALFAAVHEQKRNITNNKAMIAFFTEQGVTTEQIEQAFEQKALKDKLTNDIIAVRTYRTNAIPGFGVAGKYRTDLAMAKRDPQRMMEIVDFLVEESQKSTQAQ